MFRALRKTFPAVTNQSGSETVRAGFIGFQLHVNTVMDDFALHLLEGTSSEDSGSYPMDEDVVDLPVDSEVIDPYILIFPF